MQLRRPLVFGVFFGVATFCSFDLGAQELIEPQNTVYVDMRWQALSDDEKAIVDRLATDFYEESLRYSQASAIEAHTTKIYTVGSPEVRDRFRRERRLKWLSMTGAQRQTFRNSKRPRFTHLEEGQKHPFRQFALDRLDAAGAVDQEALNDAINSSI